MSWLRVTWLGHSTLVLDLDGVRLLTDPLLRQHAGVLRRRGPVPQPVQWQGASAVLVSHLHHDHAELPSLFRAEAPVLTAEVNAAFLRRHGLQGVAAVEDRWLDLADTGIEIRLTRADHGHRPMPHRPNATHGHLVRAGTRRIWVAGDTSLHDDMVRIPELADGEIDVAFLPVGGWGPRLSGGHLSPQEAAEACRRVGARVAVPYHWGTLHLPGGAGHPVGWMDRPGADFAAALEELAPRTGALVLAPGEHVEL